MKTKRLIIIFLVLIFLVAYSGCSDDSSNSNGSSYSKKSTANATAQGETARSKPYVASVLRDPYHESDCTWAKKISTSNLVGYDTREQAEADGHRPCKVCKP